MRKSTVLALSLFCAAALPAAKKKSEVDYSQFEKKLSKDQQILHALDRLTFGPRPGDLEAVKKMGLKKWIDLQLHPERIKENPELETKLKTFCALASEVHWTVNAAAVRRTAINVR